MIVRGGGALYMYHYSIQNNVHELKLFLYISASELAERSSEADHTFQFMRKGHGSACSSTFYSLARIKLDVFNICTEITVSYIITILVFNIHLFSTDVHSYQYRAVLRTFLGFCYLAGVI